MLWSQLSAIFAYVRQKMAFFSKTNVVTKCLQKLAVICAKNAKIFAKF
jgi:hypothetical protein